VAFEIGTSHRSSTNRRQEFEMRSRLKLGLALASAGAATVTVVWPDWIELVFHWNPDHGSGSAEWLVVVAAALTAVASSAFAALEWRRLQDA
jgi:hypothetical protein